MNYWEFTFLVKGNLYAIPDSHLSYKAILLGFAGQRLRKTLFPVFRKENSATEAWSFPYKKKIGKANKYFQDELNQQEQVKEL